MATWRPKARRERLLIRELPGETLVYDLDRHKAHCLNESAAAVWKLADGTRTPAEIGVLLAHDTLAEDLVLAVLSDFQRRKLLDGDAEELEIVGTGMSRRSWVKKAAVAAGLAIPLVTTVAAPTAAQASTCLGSGAPCTTGAQCCSGICSGGNCV